ncbi:MAG TPA: hypothetical protein VMV59_12145 [Candidatus Dormibacteraeota bacterium]|nr:hypothetical protein [Candidatus Dormibacteraeota bacterium]
MKMFAMNNFVGMARALAPTKPMRSPAALFPRAASLDEKTYDDFADALSSANLSLPRATYARSSVARGFAERPQIREEVRNMIEEKTGTTNLRGEISKSEIQDAPEDNLPAREALKTIETIPAVVTHAEMLADNEKRWPGYASATE